MKHNTNNTTNTVKGGGITFLGALTLLFIALKLLGKITWSWVWVLAPLWGGFALTILISVCILIFIAIMAIMKSSKKKDKK